MMKTETIRLGETTIELREDGMVTTKFPEGVEVRAFPIPDAYQVANAKRLGYGLDIARSTREHEVVHTLLARWLGQPRSPTLAGVATDRVWQYWGIEEAAVLAVQALCATLGVDPVRLAREMEDHDAE
jgi:hypothetical protein